MSHQTRYFENKPVAYRAENLYVGGRGYVLSAVYWNPARPEPGERFMDLHSFMQITEPAPEPVVVPGHAFNLIYA